MISYFEFKKGTKTIRVTTTTLLESIYKHPDLINELAKRLEIQADSDAESIDFVGQTIKQLYEEQRIINNLTFNNAISMHDDIDFDIYKVVSND